MSDHQLTLTDGEKALLQRLHAYVGPVIVSPDYIADLVASHSCGGGKGFDYAVTKTGLTGAWCRYEYVDYAPGSPQRLRFDPPHLEVTITFGRLRKWVTGLPAELRERARIAWATYPINTRDLGELARIVYEATELSTPVEQLELFEVA